MPIPMTCPTCEARFRLPDELAGKQVRCQRCGNRFEVRSDQASTTAAFVRGAGVDTPSTPSEDVVEAILLDPSLATSTQAVKPQLPAPTDEPPSPEPADLKSPRRRKKTPDGEPAAERARVVPLVLVSIAALVIATIGLLAARVLFSASDLVQKDTRPDVPRIAVQPAQLPVPAKPDPVVVPPIPGAPDGVVVVHGTLRASDALGANGAPLQRFDVSLERGGNYVIDLRTAAFDAELYLWDSQNRQVAHNDDFQGRDSRITFSPTADGLYRIDAATHNGSVGPFILEVRRVGGAAPTVKARPAAKERPPTAIVFDGQGEFRAESALTADDPINARRTPHHAYTLAVESGRVYILDLSSRAFDSYLTIMGDNGQVLASDDDSGGNLDSRIIYRATKTMTATVIAAPLSNAHGPYVLTVRRDGSEVAVRELPPLALPKPAPSETDDGAAKLKLPAGAEGRRFGRTAGKWMESILWSSDGKSLFALDDAGGVSRFAVGEKIEVQRLDLGRKAANMVRCKSGLLVALPELGEVWLVSESLDDIRRIAAPNVVRVAAWPASVHAVAACVPNAGNAIGSLLTLDVEAGKPHKRFLLPHQLLTAVGEKYVALNQNRQLALIKLVGPDLALEQEVGGTFGNGEGAISASSDGKHFCLPMRNGNPTFQSGRPAPPIPSVSVFETESLKQPAFVLRTGFGTLAVGFDPAAKRVVSHNSEAQLLIYTYDGEFLLGLPVSPQHETPLEFAVHPGGRRVAIRFDRHLADVTLPNLESRER